MTVDWYGKFSGWWGQIENVLMAPFPVVERDHVVPAETSREIEAAVDAETGFGAEDHRNGASDGSKTKAKRKAGDDMNASMADGDAVANGIEPASKKRKAEVMG